MMPILPLAGFPLEAVWGSAVGFVAMFVLLVGLIGVTSRSLAIPSYGAYLAFAHFATESDIAVLEPVMYVTLALITVGVAFKLWRLEGVGDI